MYEHNPDSYAALAESQARAALVEIMTERPDYQRAVDLLMAAAASCRRAEREEYVA